MAKDTQDRARLGLDPLISARFIPYPEEKYPITVQRLPTGYWHVRSKGPCNWAQPYNWPCTEKEFRASAFPEACEEFIQAALRVMGRYRRYDSNPT